MFRNSRSKFKFSRHEKDFTLKSVSPKLLIRTVTTPVEKSDRKNSFPHNDCYLPRPTSHAAVSNALFALNIVLSSSSLSRSSTIIAILILENSTIPTMFNFLTISWRFFQSFYNQRSGRRNNWNRGHTVLNFQLHSNLQTFPIGGSFGYVVTNFFRRL